MNRATCCTDGSSGAKLDAVHLPFLGFSRTDFAVNPHPLFVAWGGPWWGSLLPLAIFVAARCSAAKRHVYLLAWFAGFCLIANGGVSAWRSDSQRRRPTMAASFSRTAAHAGN